MPVLNVGGVRFGTVSCGSRMARNEMDVDYSFSSGNDTTAKEWGAIRHLPMQNNAVVIRQMLNGDALIYDILQPTHFRPVRGDELHPVLEMIGNSTLSQTQGLGLQQGVKLAFNLHKILQQVEKMIRAQFAAGMAFEDMQAKVLQSFPSTK